MTLSTFVSAIITLSSVRSPVNCTVLLIKYTPLAWVKLNIRTQVMSSLYSLLPLFSSSLFSPEGQTAGMHNGSKWALDILHGTLNRLVSWIITSKITPGKALCRRDRYIVCRTTWLRKPPGCIDFREEEERMERSHDKGCEAFPFQWCHGKTKGPLFEFRYAAAFVEIDKVL